jgi:hypothetical protein
MLFPIFGYWHRSCFEDGALFRIHNEFQEKELYESLRFQASLPRIISTYARRSRIAMRFNSDRLSA